MPWQLFEVPSDAGFDERDKSGAYWFVEAYGPGGEHHDHFLQILASDEYKRDWADKRAPIIVCLPDKSWWLVDQKYSGSNGPGWTITGDPPNLTAHPSIDSIGRYHGWLKDGVLSDDVEGRTYEP